MTESSEKNGRETVALWMMGHSYATGHGDTIEDMLAELEAQAKERAIPLHDDRPAPIVDAETVQTILDLLNPLHGELDRQLFDERKHEDLDIPRDREYSVNVTEAHERDLTQAVLILEDRKRQFTSGQAGLKADNERLVAALKSQTERMWQESDRADKADHMRVAIETGKVHPALAIDVKEHRQQAYQNGWNDGYAEGFAKAKADAAS